MEKDNKEQSESTKLVCESCDTTEKVSVQRDPYVYEIYGVTQVCTLCPNCLQQRAWDV